MEDQPVKRRRRRSKSTDELMQDPETTVFQKHQIKLNKEKADRELRKNVSDKWYEVKGDKLLMMKLTSDGNKHSRFVGNIRKKEVSSYRDQLKSEGLLR